MATATVGPAESARRRYGLGLADSKAFGIRLDRSVGAQPGDWPALACQTTRTSAPYPIHHAKYIVVDRTTIETGSFNYSKAAAQSNSENVLVAWNNPVLASQYTRHWQSRCRGQPFESACQTCWRGSQP